MRRRGNNGGYKYPYSEYRLVRLFLLGLYIHRNILINTYLILSSLSFPFSAPPSPPSPSPEVYTTTSITSSEAACITELEALMYGASIGESWAEIDIDDIHESIRNLDVTEEELEPNRVGGER